MKRGYGWYVVLGLLAAGCASTPEEKYFGRTATEANVYLAPRAKELTKVAVLPFKAPTELIGSSMADLWVTEVLRSGHYELVERSRMAQVLSEAELALSGLSATRAAEVGQMLGAEGVIVGTVDEYGTMARKGRTVPVVGVTARLINCANGKVMWSVDLAQSAAGAEVTLPRLARQVVHEMMAAIYQAW
jgi:curli biogenesis system outer membrane secretion channel CsgG